MPNSAVFLSRFSVNFIINFEESVRLEIGKKKLGKSQSMTNASGTGRIPVSLIFREVSNHKMLKYKNFVCVADFSFSQR